MFADFYINHTWLAAMDSAHPHGLGFNDAVSLLVTCETQEEIDYYWSALTDDGQPGQCGWLKDKYGVSWQVTSTVMFEALKHGSPEQIARVTQTFMTMKKVDVAVLQQAYNG
jgi:predicted 3-demethylubiquinone-9 3-methyltransferase (glyoxalase superfamily)